MTKLRMGILLIILSWLPFAQVFLWIAHNQGKLTGEDASATFRLTIWGIQIVIGLVGVWLAGKIAVDQAKQEGWRKTPAKVWDLFLHGS